MNIGLIGMSNSGKTTIFNALTRSQAQVTSYANSKSEPNRASEKQISDQGLMRLEGKKYIVQDGDVLNIRFNI